MTSSSSTQRLYGFEIRVSAKFVRVNEVPGVYGSVVRILAREQIFGKFPSPTFYFILFLDLLLFSSSLDNNDTNRVMIGHVEWLVFISSW